MRVLYLKCAAFLHHQGSMDANNSCLKSPIEGTMKVITPSTAKTVCCIFLNQYPIVQQSFWCGILIRGFPYVIHFQSFYVFSLFPYKFSLENFVTLRKSLHLFTFKESQVFPASRLTGLCHGVRYIEWRILYYLPLFIITINTKNNICYIVFCCWRLFVWGTNEICE